MRNLSIALLIAVPFFLVVSTCAQNAQESTKKEDSIQDCPMHEQHTKQDSHHATVEKHGDQGMGFPHDKTTHHFRLTPDGGVIEIAVTQAGDKTNTDAIRSHLSHIAVAFANGDFSTPMLIHDEVPPGVTTMQLLKAAIRYRYEDVASGGRVRIESNDPVAIAAIHDFLRFQITEHQTGDSLAGAEVH